MADVELSHDGLARFNFDPQEVQYPYNSRTPWSLPMEQTSSRAASQRMANVKRSTSPLQGFTHGYDQIVDQRSRTLVPEWHIPTTSGPQIGYSLNTTFPQQYTDGYAYQMSPTDFIQNQPELDASFSMENPYFSMLNPSNTTAWDSQAVHPEVMDFPLSTPGMADLNLQQQNFPENSPTDTSEIRSLTSSSSDNGWKSSELRQPSLESSFHDGQYGGALYNIGQIHHEPTFSDSSYSEIDFPLHPSWSYVDVPNLDHLSSPESESFTDKDFHHIQPPARDQDEGRDPSSSPIMRTSSTVQPIDIKVHTPPQRSPISTGRGSPPRRRQPRKDANPKATKATIRRPCQVPKLETEKKVGRRKGPLQPHQRQQACEIRKLGACLRCRFLKKTVRIFSPYSSCTILIEAV